jgi:hypothetical protein
MTSRDGEAIVRKILIGLVIAHVPTATVHADWQYAKWGMSPAEVVGASGGNVKLYEPANKFPNPPWIKAEGSYTAGSARFGVDFYFDENDKLAWVGLGQHDVAQCELTRNALVEKYGTPTDVSTDREHRSYVWRDKPADNVIQWSDTSLLNRLTGNTNEDDCFIVYKRLSSVGEGL